MEGMNVKMVNQNEPLAYRVRPKSLEEYVGQEHVIGKGKILISQHSKSFSYQIFCW